MSNIVATILAGNSEALIGDAISSAVEWVDRVLLIDTGITDGTRLIAEQLAGERLIVETFAWQNDFSAARNFALDTAASYGASWALTLDTDERLEFSGYASREALREKLDSDDRVRSWMVTFRDGSYTKERFIRVKGQHRYSGGMADSGSPRGTPDLVWSGRTHECLTGFRDGERAILPGVTAWEVRKTPEQFHAKLLRDLPLLLEETRDKPAEPRWWYYLGQTYEGIAQPQDAMDAYRRCALIRGGWPEQAAWACFKAAGCALELHRQDDALELCTLGLARQPESPELAWLAGFVSYQMGRVNQAVTWSQIAVELGHFEGRQAGCHRIGFRHIPGWYEGPYDVLRFAYQQLGQLTLAAECELKCIAAKKRREEVWGADHTSPSDRGASAASGTVITGNNASARNLRCEPIIVAHSEPTAVAAIRPQTRVAVLGLYSSGSTATAAMLHHLGVRLGRRLFASYYEPQWLAAQLRDWWHEPALVETNSREERVLALATWIAEFGRDDASCIGAKHPLLTLCGAELLDAWGPSTRFVWTWRPLEESIASLQLRKWWPGKEVTVQTRLWAAAAEFFASQAHLKIKFADTLRDPESEVDRLIEFLDLRPTDSQRRGAVSAIQIRG